MEFIFNVASVFNALGTVIVACVVTYIAYRQYKNEENKLKADLFRERFEIYETYRITISIIMQKEKIDIEEINRLVEANQKAFFLMGEEISKIGEDIYDAITEKHIYVSSKNQNENDKKIYIESQRKVNKLLQGEMSAKFAKFLSFPGR
jgi:UDP-N-acetyl-D-mannosaminuronate dehydrogenase